MFESYVAKPKFEEDPDHSSVLPHLITLLMVTCCLIFFGLTMLYSASYGTAGLQYFRKQALWVILGLMGGGAIVAVGYRRLIAISPWLIGLCIVLLLACLCFHKVNGAYRWIRIGPVSIQPSEFAKVAVALFVAKYCSENWMSFARLKWRGGILPLGAVVGAVMASVLIGHDLGTTLLIGTMACGALFVAGLPFRYIGVPLSLSAAGAVFIYFFDPMRLARITTFWRPEELQSGKGYQLWFSLLALGEGDWLGLGFLGSRMKADYLPECHTDFILSVVGEELGFIGILAVIVGFAVYGFCAWRIAMHARERSGMILGAALLFYITVQAAINLAVISGSIPTKGMPAPFISYGGSNMLASMFATALLIAIALDSIFPDYNRVLWAKIRGKNL
ncbi:MAG: putative lipid II flippase FtsW [Victivallaceae bacterium]|nr:putative lipid II flippase FtsW [Victivallaceae bacterium]